MRKINLNLMVIILLVCGFVVFNACYVVYEGSRGIVTRFGKVVRDADDALKIYDPGLHFRVPFVDKVRTMDVRIQTLSSSADRYVTSEKKDVIIDTYVKWQIEDPAKYYLTTAGGNKMQAEELLRRRINNSLRSQIGRLTIHELVSGANNDAAENDFDLALGEEALANEDPVSSSKRDQVMQNALRDIGSSAVALGIRIVDVRMKQINLPPEVSNSIYQRMRAERDAVAKLHRSEGQREAEAIRAQADREVVVKIAEAERSGRKTRGEGDAEATRIYADAYNQSPELYEFMRSMEAYRNAMSSGGDVLVLKPDSEFFKFFNQAQGD